MALNQNLTEDLRLAHLLADNADAITTKRFRARDLTVRAKADNTAVTDADTATEEAIRGVLTKVRPRDAIHGEEGEDTGWGPRRWIIDPIDGTANYARGMPVWATLIALEVEGEVVVSVVSAPALNRRWWASREGGAWVGTSLMNGTELKVSDVDRVEEAFLSYSDVAAWVDSGSGQEFVDLMREVHRARAFGDFWSYMLVAEGCVDIACEPALALHDMAALGLIVTEAGGEFTNLDGQPGPVGPGALATNGLLHDEVVNRFTGVEPTGELPTFRPSVT